MTRIRVLVVEDSRTVRARLVEVISGDPRLEVVGEAVDGRGAIELCESLRPDVMTLDMMLPVMSGLTATEYIMAHFPTPILVVSAASNRGEIFKTCDALAAGAVDVIDKPSGLDAPGVWEKAFLDAVRVVSRIKVITHPRARLQNWSLPASHVSRLSPTPHPDSARTLVVIGVSTGGPGALVQVLRGLPKNFPAPILIVMHIGAPFAEGFTDWLEVQSGVSVKFATNGESLANLRGVVRMAPPDQHLRVLSGKLVLTRGPERHSCRPSVDELFESVALEHGPSTVACLLTGMGRDGAQGLLTLRKAGALTLAQDEETSVVYGMPREAALLDAAMHIVPLDAVAGKVIAASRGERSVT